MYNIKEDKLWHQNHKGKNKKVEFYTRSKLNCYQFKVVCFIYKRFYVSLMVTTQIQRRQLEHTTMENHQFTNVGNKTGKRKNGTVKQPERY